MSDTLTTKTDPQPETQPGSSRQDVYIASAKLLALMVAKANNVFMRASPLTEDIEFLKWASNVAEAARKYGFGRD